MKWHAIKSLALLLLLTIGIPGLYAQDDNGATQTAQVEQEKPTATAIFGFEDKDNDGINDKFCDANGDGRNDLTGNTYPHGFKFIDKDNDGRNDIWQDVDGDGLNDLFHKMSKSERMHKENLVLDANNDQKNDVTGEIVDFEDLHKQNAGFWDETTGKINGPFIDEDGNGIDDRMERIRQRHQIRNRDFFVDEDGDGICDGRGDSLKRARHREHGRGR